MINMFTACEVEEVVWGHIIQKCEVGNTTIWMDIRDLEKYCLNFDESVEVIHCLASKSVKVTDCNRRIRVFRLIDNYIIIDNLVEITLSETVCEYISEKRRYKY